jgi:hypothetical protein
MKKIFWKSLSLNSFVLVFVLLISCSETAKSPQSPVSAETTSPSDGTTVSNNDSNQTGTTTPSSPDASNVDGCLKQLAFNGVCPLYCTVQGTTCVASQFSDGTQLNPAVTAQDCNSCLATVDMENQVCKLGYTWAQVETLVINCKTPTTPPIGIKAH